MKKPTPLSFLSAIPMRKVVAAKEFSFGLSKGLEEEGGVLYGWGRNDRGQMGQGGGLAMDMYSCDTIPVAVEGGGLRGVEDYGLSAADVLAVDREGNVYYWGERVFLEPHLINEERLGELEKRE